jgi:hypothetical protein
LLGIALLAGCGGSTPAPDVPEAGSDEPPLRLRHQVLVRYGDEVQVFEGYMILCGRALLVKAFAGPGIDLFTVRRDGAKHREEAHVPGLAERLDLTAVGADISRAYLPGCDAPVGEQRARCDFFGEPLSETYDAAGRVVMRSFPEAHGIGLTIAYEDYGSRAGRPLAARVVLRWGESGNEMVIRLLDAEELVEFDREQLAIP